MPNSRRRPHPNKNHYIYIFISIISWLTLLFTLVFIDPFAWQSIYYLPIYPMIFFSLFFPLCLFIEKKIINLLISFGIISILFLRTLSFTQFYYPLLIILIVITLIYFFTIDESGDKLTLSKTDKAEKNADHQTKS